MSEEPEEKGILYYFEHEEEVDPEAMRRLVLWLLKFGMDDPERSKRDSEDDSAYVDRMFKSMREKK